MADSKYTANLADRLFEACVEGDWASAGALCDDWEGGNKYNMDSIDWSTDSSVSTVLNTLCEQNRSNPLMAAVLHVAIDVAEGHKSCTLFSDIVSRELLDAEERKRLQSSGMMSFDTPLTAHDFSPYASMRKYGESDDNYTIVTDEERRLRRKVIAKLCRANPLWIIMPMIPRGRSKYDEEQTNFDDDLPRGTTPLHVAVRSRNVTLTKLLIKYCPKSAEIADLDGCIALHYAVRPSDGAPVLRRAVLTYQRSLNGGADNAPLEAGPNEVHSGANLYYHGKLVFKATHESSELARCRVRRLRRKDQLRTIKLNVDRANSYKRNAITDVAGKGKSEEGSKSSSDGKKAGSTNGKGSSDSKKKKGGVINSKRNKLKGDVEGSPSKKECFPSMYDTPSFLVRAMMSLGTIEEDATDYVQSEWVTIEDPTNARLEERKKVIASEYPIVLDTARSVTRGLGRATRTWKTERHRCDMIKLLTKAHPHGMLYQCDDGGDTPLILACQTLEGDDGEDDEFGDLLDDELDGEQEEDAAAGNNQNAPVPDEIGEDAADYEEDLPPRPDDVQPEAAAAPAPANGAQPQENVESGPDHEDANEQQQQGLQQEPGPDGEEGDPLEAVLFMISENGSNAVGVADDDGDTALHAATRIGASARLVESLLDTMSALASTPGNCICAPIIIPAIYCKY